VSDKPGRIPPWAGAWTAAAIVITISLVSTFTLSKPDSTVQAGDRSDVVVDSAPAEAGSPTPGVPQPTGSAKPSSGPVAGPGGRTYDCSKGQNAGASDIGVDAHTIRLAATVVKTGIAKDFLSDAQFGIEAVRQRVNRQGGICGRVLDMTYDDDGWRSDDGARIISKWIGGKNIFALAVNPSSEGLRGAIRSGLIAQNGFPVVGADGMLIGQYGDPWVWPVATSTLSVMHIMARDAYKRGARRFGLVWENSFRFGVEGSDAYKEQVKRLCAGQAGCGLVSEAEVKGGELSYKTPADKFVGACSDANQDFHKCDFIAVLLEPATAAQWVDDNGLGSGDPNKRPSVGIGAPQPLFVNSFIKSCGAPCSGMWVWTSFKPPIDPYGADPAVREYLSDLRAVSTSADAANPHVQGAYCGMKLLVEALRQLGASPTRASLRRILDQMSFDCGLAPRLGFRPGNHFAAVSAQAFKAVFNVNNFVGWRYTDSGFIADSDVGKDHLKD
jgi:ABC-type branched-subunit amino acid transport system substrate-binding protein